MTALNDPTPPEEIKSRQGPGGRQLSYVDARFVMDRLDAAVGPESWQDKFEDRVDGSVRCGIGILITTKDSNEWVWKWDVGDTSDIEPQKGAHSDAFKRAGVKWGIGRDLYGEKPAQRPTTARPAPAQSTPKPAAPDDFPWDGLVTEPAAPSGEGLNARDFWTRADNANLDRKNVSNVAKSMFGAAKWKVNDLTDEERAALWAEMAA